MSDKIISLADRRRAADQARQPDLRPTQTGGGEATFVRDLVRNMFGAAGGAAEGEDTSGGLLLEAMGLEMFLNSMQAPQNGAKISEQKHLTDKYSDEQLLSLMRSATDQQVKMKPQFFQALVATAKERGHASERDRASKE